MKADATSISEKIESTVAYVVRLLTNREYERISSESVDGSLTTDLIKFGVQEYPCKLVMPPIHAFQNIDIYGLYAEDNPDNLVCTIEFPLWTEEEGESQLTLLLTLYESDREIYQFSFDDLDVP